MILKRGLYRTSFTFQSAWGTYRLYSHLNIEDKYPIVKFPIQSIIPTDSFYLEKDFISDTEEDLILDYLSQLLCNKKYQGSYFIVYNI